MLLDFEFHFVFVFFEMQVVCEIFHWRKAKKIFQIQDDL